MAFKKAWVVLTITEGQMLNPPGMDGVVYGNVMGNKMRFYFNIQDAIMAAQQAILGHTAGPGTAAILAETVYFLEAPPTVEIVLSEWNDHGELIPVNVDSEE